MTTLAALNGRPQRKQLSDQLNRLDAIIDTLALLRAALGPRVTAPSHPPQFEYAPAAAPRESFWSRCRRKLTIRSESLQEVAARGVETTKAAVRETRGFVGRTVERVRAFRRGLNIAWQLKKAALVGAAVVVVALASHPLAAVLSGVGAATSAFALQVGLWFRKTAREMIA